MDGAGDLANAGELQGDGMVAGREIVTRGRFWCKRPCVNSIGNLYPGCKKGQAITRGLLQKNRPHVYAHVYGS